MKKRNQKSGVRSQKTFGISMQMMHENCPNQDDTQLPADDRYLMTVKVGSVEPMEVTGACEQCGAVVSVCMKGDGFDEG